MKIPDKVFFWFMQSPLGSLLLTANEESLTGVYMGREQGMTTEEGWFKQERPVLKEAEKQLSAYFSGKLRSFNLPICLKGTPFQMSVWEALKGIPYGSTVSYGAIADLIGNPKAVRAVGYANGRNPIPIIIPCHRVIGADGSLTGYESGLDKKDWLLKHEEKYTRGTI